MRLSNRVLLLCVTLSLAIVFPACESEDVVTGSTSSSDQTIEIRFYPKFGSDALALNQKYMNAGSDSIWFTTVRFYISEIALVDSLGNEIPVEQETVVAGTTPDVWLVDLEAADYTVNGYLSVMVKGAPGTYRGVKFSVGVPFNLNHRDVSTQDPPLGPNSGLYWAWNPGYIFHMMMGKADSAGVPIDFAYHLGEDNRKLTARLASLDPMLPTEFVVSESEASLFSVDVDYSKLFMIGLDGVTPMDIDMNPAERFHHVGPANLADRVYANTSTMFSRTP
jgi:hypothetical protein